MIVLLPTSSTQVISVMPRTTPLSDIDNSDVIITITRDGDGESEGISPTLINQNGYYIDLTISSAILEEDSTYRVEMVYNGDLWYRDKFYVTSQSNYTIKHQIAQPSYTQYNTIDDNTYIIQ